MGPLEDSLVSMRQILRSVDMNSKKLSRVTGLSTSKLLILQTVEDFKKASIGQLAQEVSLTQATVTHIVDKLQAGGFVTRERSDQDKRKVFVRLTSKGEGVLNSAPTVLQDKYSEAFAGLEEWEQMQIATVLKRVATMFGAERIDAAPVLDIEVIESPQKNSR